MIFLSSLSCKQNKNKCQKQKLNQENEKNGKIRKTMSRKTEKQ